MKKSILLLLLIFSITTVFAQGTIASQVDETMRSNDKIYVVVTIIAIVFIGISVYLFSIDRRLKKIEKEK